jgi:hypothetical protein
VILNTDTITPTDGVNQIIALVQNHLQVVEVESC